METKNCTKCSAIFPATIEYFGKCRTGKLGLNSKCKNCINELARLYRKENPERTKAAKTKLMNKNRDRYNEVNRTRYRTDLSFREKRLKSDNHSREKKARRELSDCYVAKTMNKSVRGLHPDVIQIKRLVIKLRRELGISRGVKNIEV